MNQELLLFVHSLWSGVVVAVAYDLFRIFRNVCRHSSFWIGVEDLLYWCGCGIYLFAQMYQENDGIIRFYVLGGVALGIAMYHWSISGILVKYGILFWRIPLKWIRKGIKRLKFEGNRGRLILNRHLSQRKVRKAEYEKAEQREKQNTGKKKRKKQTE